jgi:DNA-binding transcriptional ArsR family regulator
VFVVTYRLDAWALLGDASRRSIIERLSAAPCTVTELAAVMPISRPAVSQHLKVLTEAGVVQGTQQGRTRVYSIDGQRLVRYRRQLDEFWLAALDNLPIAKDQREKATG